MDFIPFGEGIEVNRLHNKCPVFQIKSISSSNMHLILPQLHDTCDIARWVDAANIVEISNVQTTIDAPC